jgi:hypothetical protein
MPQVHNCIYLGLSNRRDGYQLWYIATKSVINSRNVVFKEEILKVSNEHAPILSTPYVKKDTLFIEDSSDNNSDNEEKGDDIPLNLVKSDDENKDNNSRTFTKNRTNIIEWTSLPHESHYK